MITEKKRQVKGSVLFTVVCVMSILIIFLMGTLVLAASANNRAHKSYSSSQTEYTARAAIESFTAAMSKQPDIVGAIQNLAPGGTALEPEIILNDTSMGRIGYFDSSHNFINNKILVECLPASENQYYYTKDGRWDELNIVKITASARLGGEDSTVVAYIRKKAPNEVTLAEIKGLQTAGGSGTTTTQGVYTGAVALGIEFENAVAASTLFKIDNNSQFYTDLNFINGNLNVAASLEIFVKSSHSETVIMGDVNLENNKFVYLDYEISAPYSQKDVPYLYIDGKLTTNSSIELVKRTGMDNKDPYNVFVGSIDTWGKAVTIDGDLYIMDTGLSRIGGTSSTNLSAWSTSLARKSDTQFNSSGGNIYSKGSLELSHSNISGDVRVEGDLTLKGSQSNTVTINGNLVVGGNLIVEPNCTLNIVGGGSAYVGGTTTGYGSTPVVNSGYESKDNILHEAEYITNSGYERVDNNVYSYYLYTATESMPDWSGNKGLFGESIGWNNEAYYTFDWTKYDSTVDYSTYSLDDMRLLIDSTVPAVANGYGVASGFIKKVDINGYETGELTDKEFYYYESANPSVEVDINTAATLQPAYYTYVNFDGTDSGTPTTPSTLAVSYFNSSTGDRVASNIATTIDGVFPLSMYGTDVYPATMTREALLGEDGGANKIVRTLEEVREDLGYTPEDGFDESTYPTELPDHVTTYLWEGGDITGSDSYVIKSSIDNASTGGTKTLKIKPTGEIWIVLDCAPGDIYYKSTSTSPVKKEITASGTTMYCSGVNLNNGGSGGINIIVDDSAGSVNFLVKGDMKLGLNTIITTQKLYDRLIKPGSTGPREINESDVLGITFYGAVDSSITYYNGCTICGAAKAPTLLLNGVTTSGNDNFKNLQYKGSGGTFTVSNGAHWVGNALVEGVGTAFNNFTLLYTKTGGGGGSSIKTEAGTYVFYYFDQY